jgi:hypothetical protein
MEVGGGQLFEKIEALKLWNKSDFTVRRTEAV